MRISKRGRERRGKGGKFYKTYLRIPSVRNQKSKRVVKNGALCTFMMPDAQPHQATAVPLPFSWIKTWDTFGF